ncbi:keratin, type I cytoskeletal 18-A-like [Hemitrygon akajei]|uniref:keratin, type I cytoskeletal 18-A-like n=1 Tax=Hemitrygon akajei TaxID=2704970 RepID=UPI003BF9A3B9
MSGSFRASMCGSGGSFSSSSSMSYLGRNVGTGSFGGISKSGFSSGGLSASGYGGSSFSASGVGRSSFSGAGFSGSNFSGSSSLSSKSGGIVSNEKETMISLNNRLSSYLEQVKSLEKANTELELQLKEFQAGSALKTIDYIAYDEIIKPLREQILQIHLGNARLALDLDNATLAARDFQTKYENEFNTRLSVEADIADLKAMKNEYICNCKDLESDLTSAQDELVYLKKDHEEQLAELKKHITGTVSVIVEAASSPDLTKALEELRLNYEAMCKKNKENLDNWFAAEIETQTIQKVQVSEAAESTKVQLKELRQQCQTLQAEYDSLLSANLSLENSIAEINESYANQLNGMKMTISKLQMELTDMRNDIINKAKTYEELINKKMQLEKEIEAYRTLLQGSSNSISITGGEETSGVTTTITKTETIKRTY